MPMKIVSTAAAVAGLLALPLAGRAPVADTYLEVRILRAADAGVADFFGFSVAISGDIAIVGSVSEDGGAGDPLSSSGAAYVYERDQGGAGNWAEVARLKASDTQADDRFGWSVAISGDVAIVGAPWKDGGAGDLLAHSGAAYVYERDRGGADNWGEAAKLTASNPQAGAEFGRRMAISDGTVIVGAAEEDGGAGDSLVRAGAAYVFERNRGGVGKWGEVVKLTASDAHAGDRFGWSVSISGNAAIVGAAWKDGDAGDLLVRAGAAYVYERDDGGESNWDEVAKLTASDARRGDVFGWSVAISGDIAVVGVSDKDGGPEDTLADAGAAYVYERDQGGVGKWGEVAKLIASDPEVEDEFGWSVAISGNTVIVGATWADGGAGDPLADAGAAYVYERDQGGAGNWGEVANLMASEAEVNDRLGWSVAISGDTVVVGANPNLEEGGAGSAYVYERKRGR